jgi:hypothetical protein
MRLPKTVLFVLIFMAFFSFSQSETLVQKKEFSEISLKERLEEYCLANQTSLESLQKFQFALADSAKKEQLIQDIYQFKPKSTSKAFLFSLLLPGAGEYYANSKIKAGVFLGLEALFWTGYFVYHNKGGKKEDEFKGFADSHWNREAYHDSIWQRYLIDIDTYKDPYAINPINTLDTLWITHFLPSTKTQQYYEMVGKYDQFRFGWDDYSGGVYLTPNRSDYLDMRALSNRYFDRAKTFVIVAMGNHLLSAVDGALTARWYNRNKDRFSQFDMRVRLVEREGELIPKIALNYRF